MKKYEKKMGFEANGGFGTEQIYIERKRNAGNKPKMWIYRIGRFLNLTNFLLLLLLLLLLVLLLFKFGLFFNLLIFSIVIIINY